MKTVRVRLADDLIRSMDRAVRDLDTTRSRFIRDGLLDALRDVDDQRKAQAHRDGYRRKPVKPKEFDVRENEQIWPDRR